MRTYKSKKSKKNTLYILVDKFTISRYSINISLIQIYWITVNKDSSNNFSQIF